MSLADEFVKRLAAVECPYDHNPEGYKAGQNIAITMTQEQAERVRAAEKARCIFCIARATLENTKPRLCGVDRRESGPCPNQIPCHTHGQFM